MFGISGAEAIFVLIVAAVLIGPSKIPEILRKVIQMFSRLKKMWKELAKEASNQTATLLEGTGLEDLNPNRLLQLDEEELDDEKMEHPMPPLAPPEGEADGDEEALIGSEQDLSEETGGVDEFVPRGAQR